MKRKAAAMLLSVWCCVASAQESFPVPRPDAADKRKLERIEELQHKIQSLECEAAQAQRKRNALIRDASPETRRKLSEIDAKPAIVLNINGDTFIVNAGTRNNGIQRGDKLLIVERNGNKLRVTGTGEVDRAYDRDVECHAVRRYGISPENEVYVTNRCSSPHFITRLKFSLVDE